MKFDRIVAVDATGLTEPAIDQLAHLSQSTVDIFDDVPRSTSETVERIGSADCVLVSWNTQVGREVLERCENLKYIGLCCSLYDDASSNVDIPFARERGIVVKGIRDYGDEGLVEFVISELIRLCKGLGRHQWRSEPVELSEKRLGIVGLGTTGRLLADRAAAFGMSVSYFSRTRKSEAERVGIDYLPLEQLLTKSDMISLHLSKHTNLLGPKEFAQLGVGKVLINTSLGLVFDKRAFVDWVEQPGNFAIFDGDGAGSDAEQITRLERVIATDKVSGWTLEARHRLSEKVLHNVMVFLQHRQAP